MQTTTASTRHKTSPNTVKQKHNRPFSVPAMSRTVLKAMERDAPLVLKEDKADMQKALQAIPRNPKAQRGGGAFSKRGQEDNNGDKNKGQIPDNVENQNGHRVGAIFPEEGAAIEIVGGIVFVVVVGVGSGVGAVCQKGAVAVGGNQTGSVAS